MDLRVIVEVPIRNSVDRKIMRLEALACSIECARHHGYEPSRMLLPDERGIMRPCAFCGAEPEGEEIE
jgi:hypothetical protein